MSAKDVAQELTDALEIFTEEAFGEYVGFKVEDGEVRAEEYDDHGEIIAHYKITFTINETSN